ncbi:MAG: NifB/NifX family molybdenum-iron cluster-binding protein [Chloroflexota bacterium]
MIKIAFPTDDGEMISAHFGRAPLFVVVTANGPEAPQFEKRDKAFHGSAEQSPANHTHNHNSMFEPIADCQVLIAGGMGQPAYEHAIAAGLKVLLTDQKSITRALAAYNDGQLISDPRRIHQHR